MSDPLFDIRDASVFIPGHKERRLVLKNITWSLCKGEHCAILGPNGAGKSSLLKLIHGDLWPCGGWINWFDWQGNREDSRIAARELTAIISPEDQEKLQRSPWPHTVASFLEKEGPGTIFSEKITEILEESGLLSRMDDPLPSLSQGRLRLLMLLKALLARPRVLLLDEFSDSLDPHSRKLAYDLLDLACNDITMIFTSHRPLNLPDWCEKRLYLNNGKQEGEKARILPQPTVHLVGNIKSSEPLFAISNATVYINRHKILKNLDWQVMLGEHWRVSGDNGSGKSTLLRLLAGDEFASSDGEIKRWNPVCGRWMNRLEEVRKRVMLVSDLSQVLNNYPLTSYELLCTAFDNTTGLHREITREEKGKALAILRDFFPEMEVGELASTDIRRLSTGQIRRLYLARAMLANPSALLLDEPLNGLDNAGREHFLNSLYKLVSKNKNKLSVIMVSHYDEDEPGFISHHARLENGRLNIID